MATDVNQNERIMAEGEQRELFNRFENTVVTRPDPTERVNQSIKDAVKAVQELLEAKLDKNTEIYQERYRILEVEMNRLRDGLVTRHEHEQHWKDSDDKFHANSIMILDKIKNNNDSMFDRIKTNQETIIDKIKSNQEYAKSAVEAAFTTAGTAADKQEKSFIKLLDTLGATVTDLKDRIVVMEGKSSIVDPTINNAIRENAIGLAALKESKDLITGRHQQSETSTGTWIAIIAAIAAMALVLVDAAGLIHK
jgi:hypothetical protein